MFIVRLINKSYNCIVVNYIEMNEINDNKGYIYDKQKQSRNLLRKFLITGQYK